MRKKATRQQTKNHNIQLVLQTIFASESISRADIARATQLTRPTVSALVAELQEAGILIETGRGLSAGGKRPTLLAVDPNARQIACLDIGNQIFRGALFNLRGEITKRIEVAAQNQTGKTAVHTAYTILDQLLAHATAPILGIGIGTPGITDPVNGIVREAVNLNWHNLPLKAQLTQQYSLPTHLINDSHAAALGEYKFGQPRQGSNLIVIKTGRGIGAGIILQGQPFYGDSFGAGEIGQLIVAVENEQIQTLESVASTQALLQQARAVAGEALTWEGLVTAVRDNHAPLKNLFNKAAEHLGTAVGQLIAAYNIHHIVFSGRFIDFGDLFQEIVFTTARQRVLPAMAAQTRFALSELGTDIVLMGCSALIVKEELGII
ncbi:MAG: ROK family transcriptional regulator [Chloroflexota bacterium]